MDFRDTLRISKAGSWLEGLEKPRKNSLDRLHTAGNKDKLNTTMVTQVTQEQSFEYDPEISIEKVSLKKRRNSFGVLNKGSSLMGWF